MPKIIVKRKSTFIDMTAMSDVTVLLLTFFMLTSTFIQKEPVVVTTPASVSEIKNTGNEYSFHRRPQHLGRRSYVSRQPHRPGRTS